MEREIDEPCLHADQHCFPSSDVPTKAYAVAAAHALLGARNSVQLFELCIAPLMSRTCRRLWLVDRHQPEKYPETASASICSSSSKVNPSLARQTSLPRSPAQPRDPSAVSHLERPRSQNDASRRINARSCAQSHTDRTTADNIRAQHRAH